MKTNTTNFSSWFKVATVSTILIAAITPATAQSDPGAIAPSLPNNVINGLFTPTQSQEFFEEGRAAFEREVEIFNNPERYADEDLLQFDRELIKEMEQLQQKETRNEEQDRV